MLGVKRVRPACFAVDCESSLLHPPAAAGAALARALENAGLSLPPFPPRAFGIFLFLIQIAFLNKFALFSNETALEGRNK